MVLMIGKLSVLKDISFTCSTMQCSITNNYLKIGKSLNSNLLIWLNCCKKTIYVWSVDNIYMEAKPGPHDYQERGTLKSLK